MTERKLASIQTIAEIKSIEGADRIVAYRVNGWYVVDAKDKYSVGDSVVYCEVDSFIPTEVAPFLTRPEHFPKEFLGVQGERLRTIKLKGQLSQGLLLNLYAVLQDFSYYHANGSYPEGQDVTVELGILKWEKPLPACLAGVTKGSFPSFIPKTDQERVQNLSKEVEAMQGELFEVTIKLDGSSCTIFVNGEENGVCSRNLELKQTEGNAFWDIAVVEDVHTKVRATGRNLALQGELIGPSIQGNYERVAKNEFYVYDVFDIDKQAYLLPEERWEVVKQLGLKHVPIVTGFQRLSYSVQQFLDMAEGEGMNKGVKREGLVFKHLHSDFSFKAISNSYLLKEK